MGWFRRLLYGVWSVERFEIPKVRRGPPPTGSVAWAEDLGMFVTVGDGPKILTSQDGICWTLKGSKHDLFC
jgi:hypothetical protein